VHFSEVGDVAHLSAAHSQRQRVPRNHDRLQKRRGLMHHCMTPCAFITVVLRFCSIIGVLHRKLRVLLWCRQHPHSWHQAVMAAVPAKTVLIIKRVDQSELHETRSIRHTQLVNPNHSSAASMLALSVAFALTFWTTRALLLELQLHTRAATGYSAHKPQPRKCTPTLTLNHHEYSTTASYTILALDNSRACIRRRTKHLTDTSLLLDNSRACIRRRTKHLTDTSLLLDDKSLHTA
jgi:hypothetical protein